MILLMFMRRLSISGQSISGYCKDPYMGIVCPSMNDSNLYDYVMRCLTTLRYTRRQVAEGSGVPFSTVCKVAQRSVKEPSVHTIQAMADFFSREMAKQDAEKEAA